LLNSKQLKKATWEKRDTLQYYALVAAIRMRNELLGLQRIFCLVGLSGREINYQEKTSKDLLRCDTAALFILLLLEGRIQGFSGVVGGTYGASLPLKAEVEKAAVANSNVFFLATNMTENVGPDMSALYTLCYEAKTLSRTAATADAAIEGRVHCCVAKGGGKSEKRKTTVQIIWVH